MSTVFPRILTQVAFASLPGDDNPSWSDISPFVKEMTIAGAHRQRELDRYEAGTLDALLDNSADPAGANARFNPNNASSPYFPNVLPMRRIRVTGGYVAEVLLDSPNAYYRCGDRATDPGSFSGVVRDERGKSPGVTSPTVGFGATGVIPMNNALGFLAAHSDQITIPDTGFIRFNNDLTVEAWVNKQSGANGGVFYKGAGGGNEGYSLFFIGNQPHFRIYEAGGTQHDLFGGAVTPGTYSHIVGTYAQAGGGVMRLFVDNVQVASATVGSFTVRNGFADAFMGSNGGGLYLDGWLDEVALYSYALPFDRIAAHHDAGISGLGGDYLFNGYVEDWPQSSDYPFEGSVRIKATDAFLALASAPLDGSPYEVEVRADDPVVWWRLSDQDAEGGMIDSVAGFDGHYQSAPATGAESLVAGQSLSSTRFDTGNLQCGRFESTSGPPLTGYPYTVEAVFSIDEPTPAILKWLFWISELTTTIYGIELFVFPNGNMAFFANSAGQARALHTSVGVADGNPHHVAVVAASASSIRIYVDGIDVTVVDTAGTPAFPTAPLEYVAGNRRFISVASGGLGGAAAEVALYAAALSADRVAAHALAMRTAWKGDLSGTRVSRILDAVGWPAVLRDIDAGQSTLQAQTFSNALDALQAIAETELGAVFPEPNGAIKFRDRHALLKAPYTTSVATFSDQAAGVNYDEIEPDFAVDLIRNVARVSRAGGAVQRASDATSAGKFFPRKYDKSGLLLERDAEARDQAQYVVNRYGSPPFRFGKLTVTPTGIESTVFPLLLSLRNGHRITVEQQAPGVASPDTRDMHVDGKTLIIVGTAMQGDLQLTPVDPAQYFTLGVSTLNGAHVLGY